MKYQAVIFDADGVLVRPGKLFSVQYSEKHGLNPEDFKPFFKGVFQQALVGKADLHDLIKSNHPLWQWAGDPAELTQQWFRAENHPNQPALTFINELKAAGVPCFLATNQEAHRAEFIRNEMFPGVFDDLFFSCDLGVTKPSAQFFEAILSRIAASTTIPREKIHFFDDDPENINGAQAVGLSSTLSNGDVEAMRIALGM